MPIDIAMPIVIATNADVAALVDLVNLAYRGVEKGWTSEAHLVSGARTDSANMAGLMEAENSVVLKYDGPDGLTGCVHLQKQGEKLCLGMLSVMPRRQASGIGKELLSAADHYALNRNCTHIRITVISIRHELVAWYERHGYRRTGEILPFHPDGKFGVQNEPLELIVLEKGL
jgi:ribosomal protein S18 acetylase RimI-like enzyme